ncbi:hypothetical protein QUA56_34940 [Microcoleus sp. N3A4]
MSANKPTLIIIALWRRELVLFSDLVNLMSLVVCRIYPSVNAADRERNN